MRNNRNNRNNRGRDNRHNRRNSGTYRDGNGYERGHSNLIHRQVAYNKIYLRNRDEYPLPFSSYVIHHKDHNKQNNKVWNLELMSKEAHNEHHGFNNSKPISQKPSLLKRILKGLWKSPLFKAIALVGFMVFGLPIIVGMIFFFNPILALGIGIIVIVVFAYWFDHAKKEGKIRRTAMLKEEGRRMAWRT